MSKWLLLPLMLIQLQGWSQKENPTDFEIYKNLELFELVYKTVDMEYVDVTNPGHLMKTAIDAMLAELDPYTNYIPESKIEDYKLMTTGQYGGIGALIQQQDDKVVITDPHEGYPAQKAGLYAGDEFIEIDDKNVEGLSSSEVSEKLKGKPGSEVKIKVNRNGETITKTLTREEVKLSPVPYYGMVNEDVGYIKLTSFTKTAGEDVKAAFGSLKKDKNMQKLILDLRGNPGGLLIEAVKIVNMFVNKGEVIVWMKGRDNRNDVSYAAPLKPEDLNIPVVVLVDGNSASASEIVSGALQDFDRAVVVGQTSYGKGLVQRPLDLKYNAKIKVTIAKYYTPSGRCIQKLDYTNRKEGDDASAVSDSLLHKFKTRNGREVLDGRGIEPDVKVPDREYSRLLQTLVINNIIFDFATKFRAENESIAKPGEYNLSDDTYKAFVTYVMEREFEYSTASGDLMKRLEETAKDENYLTDAEAEFNALMEKFKPSKERDLQKFKSEITEILEDEIIGRYYFQKGRIEQNMGEDPFILEAVKILNDPSRYKSILNIQE
ncbi:S41 family peptidase [Paracrocinitomix mangrovi]|uniref:S41 family peptidase n=1 Tax=Paracrocinitomix mangrovi TaxID=2862509 RepID=UPI001EDAD0D4|nr:S41 family peptidase [Paracrocinitomix mangrovi]UKN00357.1 S41 family peptidase [Paracrocinitomix mangrovi]